MKKKIKMKYRYIIWIDHKKAIIGKFDPEDHFTHTILRSGIETRVRFKGETTNRLRLLTNKRTRETNEKHKFDQQLSSFCDNAVKNTADALSVLITGPAGTKKVLKRQMEELKEFEEIPVTVKPADKLTITELREKGRKYFKIPPPVYGFRKRPLARRSNKLMQ